jgi:hypothetical protein
MWHNSALTRLPSKTFLILERHRALARLEEPRGLKTARLVLEKEWSLNLKKEDTQIHGKKIDILEKMNDINILTLSRFVETSRTLFNRCP